MAQKKITTLSVIEKAARDKLRELDAGVSNDNYLSQLMWVGKDFLEMKLNMYDLQKIEDTILDLEAYGPEIAVRFLKHAAITEEEVTEELSDEEEILERIASIKTDEDVAEMLILELLWAAMSTYLDDFPTRLSMS